MYKYVQCKFFFLPKLLQIHLQNADRNESAKVVNEGNNLKINSKNFNFTSELFCFVFEVVHTKFISNSLSKHHSIIFKI